MAGRVGDPLSPFAPSLSKGLLSAARRSEGFDKLSPNGEGYLPTLAYPAARFGGAWLTYRFANSTTESAPTGRLIP